MKKDILPSNRNFGIVFTIVFLIISFWPLLKNGDIRYWSLIISLIFFVLALINSKILTPLNKVWMKFGLILGKIVSPLVMGLIFFFVVTPTGIIMRLLGKDLLNLKKKSASTYWIKKENKNNNMKNQF
ncbi:SxtJ family membrane protein [Candidatus Pelagibacter ubique]|nr:SxtJ family membrane protein [Candidatus Pelagibacter ubique]